MPFLFMMFPIFMAGQMIALAEAMTVKPSRPTLVLIIGGKR